MMKYENPGSYGLLPTSDCRNNQEFFQASKGLSKGKQGDGVADRLQARAATPSP